MSDLDVISYRPEPVEYAWTFGGATLVMRLTPPIALSMYTEDVARYLRQAAFDGVHDQLRELATSL